MRLFTRLFAVIFSLAILADLLNTINGETMPQSSREVSCAEDAIIVTSLLPRPEEEDTICCDSGSFYTITDLSRYQRNPSSLPYSELLASLLVSNPPQAEAIHFSDISGDYLFVKNISEMYRMLYTLIPSEGTMDFHTQFSIPEDAVPSVSESWDTEQYTGTKPLDLSRTYCLECWDIYKNGAFQKTVYLTAAI